MRREATVRCMCDVPLSSGECLILRGPNGRFRTEVCEFDPRIERPLSLLIARQLPFRFRPNPVVWTRLAEGQTWVASGQAGRVSSVRSRPLARCYPNLLYCPIASVFTGAYIDNTFGSFYFCSTFNNASSIFLSGLNSPSYFQSRTRQKWPDESQELQNRRPPERHDEQSNGSGQGCHCCCSRSFGWC